jgi:hypothetical protein
MKPIFVVLIVALVLVTAFSPHHLVAFLSIIAFEVISYAAYALYNLFEKYIPTWEGLMP